MLEGGYDLEALATSLVATLEALGAGEAPAADPGLAVHPLAAAARSGSRRAGPRWRRSAARAARYGVVVVAPGVVVVVPGAVVVAPGVVAVAPGVVVVAPGAVVVAPGAVVVAPGRSSRAARSWRAARS